MFCAAKSAGHHIDININRHHSALCQRRLREPRCPIGRILPSRGGQEGWPKSFYECHWNIHIIVMGGWQPHPATSDVSNVYAATHPSCAGESARLSAALVAGVTLLQQHCGNDSFRWTPGVVFLELAKTNEPSVGAGRLLSASRTDVACPISEASTTPETPPDDTLTQLAKRFSLPQLTDPTLMSRAEVTQHISCKWCCHPFHLMILTMRSP